MKEAPENSKESSHPAHANGMNECVRNKLRLSTFWKHDSCKTEELQ